jgi:hypothetical protein
MKENIVMVLLAAALAAAFLFAGFQWGKSSVRVIHDVTTTTYPVIVEVPAKEGHLESKPKPSIAMAETVVVHDSGAVLHIQAPQFTRTMEDTNIRVTVHVVPMAQMVALDYYIKAYKIRDSLVVRDSNSYIDTSPTAWSNWWYVPVGILVGAAAIEVIKGP